MELLVDRIFDRVEQNPDSVNDMRRMMDYYLPTTMKLLEAYEELDAQITQILDDMSTADSRLATGEITEDEYMSIYIRYMEVENKKRLFSKRSW